MLRRMFQRPTIGHSATIRPAVVAAVLLAQTLWGAVPSRAQDAPAPFVVSLERSFGPGWLQSIVALPGGGYAVAGRWEPDRGGSVIRLDEKGGIVWATTVEGKQLYPFGGLLLTRAANSYCSASGVMAPIWA